MTSPSDARPAVDADEAVVSAFLAAHAGCQPDRVDWLITEGPAPAVTLTCGCGQVVTVPCSPALTRWLVVLLRAQGVPVRVLSTAPGRH